MTGGGGVCYNFLGDIPRQEGNTVFAAPGVLPKGVMVMTGYELLMVILTILALLFAVNNKK